MFQLWYGISKAQEEENTGLQHLDYEKRGRLVSPVKQFRAYVWNYFVIQTF